MPFEPTTANIRGLAIGAAILTLFGLGWAIGGLVNWSSRPPWSITLAIAVATALVVASVLRAIRPGGDPASDPSRAAAQGRRSGMLFGIVSTLEGIFIALAAIFLSSHGLGAWVAVAIAIIVGVHFLPLAHIFRVALYYATGISAVLAAVAVSLAIHEPAARATVLGLSMAAILWLTAAAALLKVRPQRL